ncbi:ParB/RepB/Spo0J family partition protein [Sulfitobacter donghicola]|uniref:Chromosome partitioning protein ParB n=1 Tax=Sulfitobacter donghicola DSW-25 = KCTC 12864 = JCM 14565 TaxID=1300350 RepID=A0A073IF06_9RHOB|nr:ParB/RepB/Spo0J family partition protein [Sulfitobacter donghicola]KEJ88135.1 chromosome partitioning protein ParB [Sulfitobacter donghicola DSW-25 = KCTC 12864 = JCM 14565]KIN70070.1 Plasmid partitioning protein ParB [Sulfitobacter donghicola DSW-25 = KCTC 12864 = JCM 14565]
MSKKHDAIFDDVLSDLDTPAATGGARGSARFLKRSTAISDRMTGELEEKTLRWVDPKDCRMWERHNRDYGLLNEENCRDLIDGIKAQGRQEFPAIVRPIDDPDYKYEVICGARRHFAVSWLRGNNYTQFKYLIEAREMNDEEAFRLADIENREREDISDYERAIDYADAIARYYGGKQKAMAERLEVSQPWLSRYLALAALPEQIVNAFPTIRDLKERHARDLKPLLARPATAEPVLAMAARIEARQQTARNGRGPFLDALDVVKQLKIAGEEPKVKPARKTDDATYRRSSGEKGVTARKKGRKFILEFEDSMSEASLRGALDAFLADRFGK